MNFVRIGGLARGRHKRITNVLQIVIGNFNVREKRCCGSITALLVSCLGISPADSSAKLGIVPYGMHTIDSFDTCFLFSSNLLRLFYLDPSAIYFGYIAYASTISSAYNPSANPHTRHHHWLTHMVPPKIAISRKKRGPWHDTKGPFYRRGVTRPSNMPVL